MKKLIKKYPSFKKQITDFNGLYSQLKKRMRIKAPPEPTADFFQAPATQVY